MINKCDKWYKRKIQIRRFDKLIHCIRNLCFNKDIIVK